MNKMNIQFLGATQTVTGSKYIVNVDNLRLMIDCGLFQGNYNLRRRNWNPLPIKPASIDVILLTHAHIDHSGYIPLLVKNGFKGKIYTTQCTYDLCKILLPDSGHLQEEEAISANKYHSSKHSPALPLYTAQDAYKSLEFFEVIPRDQSLRLSQHVKVQWHRAGHILGACFLELLLHGQRLVFTGDLGRPNDPVMYPPAEPPEDIDYFVMESTYGDRKHKEEDPLIQLKEVINETVEKGGTLVIPAFAVGRTQIILYYLYLLKKSNQIDDLPIFLDSPMATSPNYQIF